MIYKKLNLPFAQEVRDYTTITFGLLCYAVGFTCFLLPYEIVSGGVTGLGAVIFYGTGFPAQYTYLIINIVLLIAAISELGWRFCIKTIYAVLMLTLLLGVTKAIMQWVGTQPSLGHFALSSHGLPQIVPHDMFMSCILGAVLEGIGLGIVFLSNGSTGGVDIIAAIVNKYRDVTLGQIIMLCDLTIVSSSLMLPAGNIQKLIFGFCTLIITGFTIDYIIDRSRQSVQFFIFSLKYNEIASVINDMHRGVTVLEGQGWYTKKERKVLVVLAKKAESPTIFRIIQTIDPNAFVSQSKVTGVFGEGFDRIKVKASK
ncbi:MAG: YitT family protein [Prevotellaceae bacterium]|nr:YitT family protein [Prevotellaceae bacterium]